MTIGVAAGAAAALLAAPMRGEETRAGLRTRARSANATVQRCTATTRSWAQQTWDRGLRRIEEARRTVRTGGPSTAPAPLTARVSELISTHDNSVTPNLGAQS